MSDDLVSHLRNADIGICDQAADEIEALRAVVNVLHHQRPPGDDAYGWMKHSPADDALRRALGNQEEYDRG